MNLLCLWHIINWKQRTFESCHISIFKNHSGHKYSRQRCIWPPFSPWSSSVGRVWLCVCSPGLGSRTEIRSEAYCLAGKTRIIFLTFSYLHATMREDRMSKLFRKISPYTEKHLHLLLVSSSTSTQWAGPLYCACICVCVRVCLCFLLFFSWDFRVSVCLKGASVRQKKELDATTNSTFAERGRTVRRKATALTGNLEEPAPLLAVCLKRGFQLTAPAEEQPNKNLNNKNSIQSMLVRCAHIP